MRNTINPQMTFGEINIGDIEFDLKSRDELPKALLGLQYIYCDNELREKVFGILENDLVQADMSNGRTGMDLWEILCLGVSRLVLNTNFDRLHDLANNHTTLRLMLGYGPFNRISYSLQAIKDNVSLFTPAISNKINDIVVEAGHSFVKKKEDKIIEARVDSFVVETNVHYPVDYGLLFEALRKVILVMGYLCFKNKISIFKQSINYIKKLKRLYRRAQKAKRSKAKNRDQKIKQAFEKFLELVSDYLDKSKEALSQIENKASSEDLKKIFEVKGFIEKVEKLREQVNRRVLNGEKILHEEKIFSIFEEYTEWICKGKAGVPQELGLNVAIIEDQYGFILNHRIMKKEKDVDIAVEFILDTKAKYNTLASCSFDKGFSSIENKIKLEEIIDEVVLPKKGKQNEKEKIEENSDRFKFKKRKHSGVESTINSLENHSLDRCPDRGIHKFETYVAFAVLGFNLHRLGNHIKNKKIISLKISEGMKRTYKVKLKKIA